MIKKIVLFALLLIPVGMMAQESKIAYVNSAEIIQAMPEFTAMQTQIQTEQAAVEKEMQTLSEEYSKKYEAFMAESESLTESIRERRLQEIQNIEERAQTFAQKSQQSLVQLQQSLFLPIREKIQKALTSVGDANNFSYILDVSSEAGIVVYVNPNSVDATSLVKKELGIQ
ncbi:OmpH family outer membrane protein [Bacteroidales bacterium OttesenSCG-928-M11]|nr:OmpH family outer membrane protein [Bacteroidales bacterium OttesenSCG-928-M11]